MTRLKALVASLVLALGIGWNPAQALDNDVFAFGIGGTKPVLWKQYEPLLQNAGECLKRQRSDAPVCRQVTDMVAKMMVDAILQASMLNATVQGPVGKFCDADARDFVLKMDSSLLAAYAILLVDDYLKYGSGLYADRLPNTYLGKIVFDALYNKSPCPK